jgi:hypothetical protein
MALEKCNALGDDNLNLTSYISNQVSSARNFSSRDCTIRRAAAHSKMMARTLAMALNKEEFQPEWFCGSTSDWSRPWKGTGRKTNHGNFQNLKRLSFFN